MARSKTYRRTRNSLGLGLVLLLLWVLDLGGPSPKDGQREKNRAPTKSEAAKGDAGDQQAKKGDPEQAQKSDTNSNTNSDTSSGKSAETRKGQGEVGPVRKPPEDVLGGLEATFGRFLLDEDYELARAWVERQLASPSESILQLARKCRVRLQGIGAEKEATLRSRILIVPLSQAEVEIAWFAEEWPKRMEGLLVELPAEVRKAPTSDVVEAWSRKINTALPVEIMHKVRLLRLSKGKGVLRVPGKAGGFRHHRVELTTLPPERLLALCPASEEQAARSFLSSLYFAAGLPVSASWLFFGEVKLKPRALGPGR